MNWIFADANVVSMFRIADRFEVQRVIADCESHLLAANDVPWFDKLKLAADLDRDHLKVKLGVENGTSANLPFRTLSFRR